MTSPTPTYSPITARRAVARSKGAPYLAEVGADNGQIWGPPGYVYVREPLSYDLATGQVTGGQTYLVRGHGDFLPNYGVKVWVEYVERYDDWMIIETDPDGLIQMDLDPNILNQLNPYSKYIDTLQLLPGLPYPVSGGETDSTKIQFKNLHWLDYRGRHQLWSVDPFDRPDLADYEPASGTKRLVQFWARHDGTVSVSQGTAIGKGFAFQADTHLTEVLEDRPDQLAIPLGAMIMGEGDTATTDEDRYPIDTRPWITNIKYAGFPNPVDKNYRVPAGVSEIVADKLTVTAKLTIEGKLTITSPAPALEVWRDHEPSSYTLVAGSLSSGTITDAQVMYDGNELAVDDVAASPGIDLYFNFTGINTEQYPNFLVARWKYGNTATTHVTIDLYNYTTTSWDIIHVFQGTITYFFSKTMYIPIGNQMNYVDSSGNAIVRFNQEALGTGTKELAVDYVGLTHGVHH